MSCWMAFCWGVDWDDKEIKLYWATSTCKLKFEVGNFAWAKIACGTKIKILRVFFDVGGVRGISLNSYFKRSNEMK